MASIKLFFEALKLFLSAWKFVSGQITEAKFRSAVNERKKFHSAYLKGNKKEKLKALKDAQK